MDILNIAAVAMQDDIRRLNAISQNIANVTTTGYKKQIAATFAAQLAGLNASEAVSRRGATTIDASPGPLRPTGNANDVAIEGDGFFELVTPQGPAYTRQGTLHTNIDGLLVGAQGLPVAGAAGPIRLLNAPFTVASNGSVEQSGRIVGQLKLVYFEQAAMLQSSGEGMYLQGAARLAQQPRTSTVRVGFLEGSNVSSPQEMVRLSETVRHFESLQRIVQGYDETLEKAIRKLGEF